MRKRIILVTVMLLVSLIFTISPMNVESQDVQPETMIKGRVFNNVTGEPIPGALVRLFTGTQGYVMRTDENGGYEFALQVIYKEEYEIYVRKDGYYDQWASGEINRGDILIINFELEPIPCKISGYILDLETEEPIFKVYVFAYSSYSNEKWETETDLYGYFELFLEPDRYELHCSTDGYVDYQSEEFILDEGQELEMNISLKPVSTGVFGMVTNDGGGAIPDAYVRVYNDYYFESDISDEEGKYDIRAPPGEYTIQVSAEGYFDHEDTIEIPEDKMLDYDVVMSEITVTGALRFILDYILEVIGGIF